MYNAFFSAAYFRGGIRDCDDTVNAGNCIDWCYNDDRCLNRVLLRKEVTDEASGKFSCWSFVFR